MAAKRREGLAWKRKRWSTATAGCNSDGVTSGNVAIARGFVQNDVGTMPEAGLQEVEERAQLIVVGGGLGLGLVGDDVGEVAHE